MELDTNLRYDKTSNLQGVLMENIDTVYANKLHESTMHPYSQHVENINDKSYWIVNAVNKEAEQQIIDKLMNADFREFCFKKDGKRVKIVNKEVQTLEERALLNQFYSNEVQRYINLEFVSPTSFKRNGRYMIMPDVRLIFQNIMNKYSTSSDSVSMLDTDALDQLEENCYIVNYRLRSVTFPMEKTKIPSFMGGITIKVNGPETMVRYANMLTDFSEYSGIGIKTAVGMGAVRKRDWRKNNDRSGD